MFKMYAFSSKRRTGQGVKGESGEGKEREKACFFAKGFSVLFFVSETWKDV